jgi:hypothetical protein
LTSTRVCSVDGGGCRISKMTSNEQKNGTRRIVYNTTDNKRI